MPVPKVQNANGTANRIVEAAVQLFSRQGFAAGSTHEIARLAGVSEVTVFRHFPRKRDLFGPQPNLAYAVCESARN